MASARESDYVDVAKNYARKVVRDKKRNRHCFRIQQAAQRFLDDLARARKKTCPFLFDRWHANDVCSFIEKLPHVEGVWDKPTITLHESQCFFLVQLFGFRKREPIIIDGEEFRPRRFSSALYCTPRKNAKSTLAAGIMIYCKCCEPEPGAQLISAATTFDQASVVWGIAKKMVAKTPDLREHFGLETWAKSITREETGASFKPLHAKASTQDGLNPSHTVIDEIHAHKTPDLLNVLESAAGARINPLWLYATTDGYVNAGPWQDLRRFAHQLLDGVFGYEADHFLVVMYCVDEEDKTRGITEDPDFAERSWQKANPLWDVNPILREKIAEKAVEAKHMPSKLAEFKIKRLNRPASTASGHINLVDWKKCNARVDLRALRHVPCWGGLDLASTRDIASLRLVWRFEDVIYTHGWRWVPEDMVKERTERNTVPYASWVAQKLITQTEGNSIDHRVIEKKVLRVAEFFNLQQLAYDPWQAADLVNRLTDEGLEMLEFIQGPRSYHPAMQAIEIAYVNQQLAHGGDPVLEWMASNLVARRDVNLNMAPDRNKSADKIDDMAALYMATGIMIADHGDGEGNIDDFLRNPIAATA